MADVKMSRGPLGEGKNWVTDAGGLPPILRGVARHMMAQGRSESESIAIAINWAKKMCATGRAFGEKVAVSPEARAQACAAVARWESMKAAARATPNKGASLSTSPCTDCSQTVDLAAWDGAKHPRVSKGKAGGGRFAGKNSDGGPPEDVQAQVRDFQHRHGLPVTGQFDAATTQLMHYHASGAAAKAAGGAKAAAKKQASAAKKAAAKAARDRKHAQALAKAKAKREAAAKKKADKAAAAAAKQRASATVSAVNRLTPAQRRVYRQKSPTPPAGYMWTSDNKLKAAPTATQRQAQASVSKTLGPAPKPAVKKAAPKPKATPFQLMIARRRKALNLSEQATGIDLAMSVTSTTDGPSLTVPAGPLTSRAKRVLLRRKMAMPPATAGGAPRFPIRNHDDVKKAVRAVGRAKGDHAAVRRHIVRRARAVGASHLIPDHWGEKDLAASEGRAVDLSQPQRFRRELIIDLAAARGHHVPGTAYHWRHNWRPIDVYTALKHRRPDLARHLLRHGAPFHNDEPRGFPAPRRLNIPLTGHDRTRPPERKPQPPRAPRTSRTPKPAKPSAEEDAALVAAAKAQHGDGYAGMRNWPDEALAAQSREKETAHYRNYVTGEVTEKQVATSRAKLARKMLATRRTIADVTDRRSRKASDGDPVSKSVEIRNDVPRPIAAEVDRSLAAIDKVHHDGQLTPIPVVKSAAKTRYGQYDPNRGGTISVTVDGDHKALTTTHEIGHWLDSTALGNPDGSLSGRNYASDKSATAGWNELWRVIGNDPTYQHMGTPEFADLAKGDRSYARYLRTKKETWARAYAQYIALRSGDPKMRAEVDEILSRRNDPSYRSQQGWSQWPWDEFEPIAGAIDRLLTERGWRK